jgi:hypothetical protein
MPGHKRPLCEKGTGHTLLRDRDRALLGLLPAMGCPAPVQRLDGDMAASSPASGSSPKMRTTLSSSRQTSCAPAHQSKEVLTEAPWDVQQSSISSYSEVIVICSDSCEVLSPSSINVYSLCCIHQHLNAAWHNT